MEFLIREVSGSVSISKLSNMLLAGTPADLPQDDILCGRTLRQDVYAPLLREFEVDIINISLQQRRVDCGWTRKTDGHARWFDAGAFLTQLERSGQDEEVFAWLTRKTGGIPPYGALQTIYLDREGIVFPFVQIAPVDSHGAEDTFAVVTYDRSFVMLKEAARGAVASCVLDSSREAQVALFLVCIMVAEPLQQGRWRFSSGTLTEHLTKEFDRMFVGVDEKYELAVTTVAEQVSERGAVFAPDRWLRV